MANEPYITIMGYNVQYHCVYVNMIIILKEFITIISISNSLCRQDDLVCPECICLVVNQYPPLMI